MKTTLAFPEDDNLRKGVEDKLQIFVGRSNTPEVRSQISSEIDNFLKTNYEKWKKNSK
jgi:hypothetical protein